MHGVMSSGLRISESVPTLPEVLSANGYATAGFGGGNPSLFHDAGIIRGFDFYDDCRSIWALVPQKILSRLGLVARMDMGSARTTPHAEIILDKAASWLNHDPGRPFFMLVHLMDVHAPYLPPDGYADRFGEAPEGGSTDLRLNKKCNSLVLGKSEKFFELVESGDFDRMKEMDITYDDISENELDRLVDLYDGSIAYADSRLEIFLDELSDKGILDETLIIVTADHGEGFLDHGRLFHSGDLVYDELMRVPLIMRYPKAIPAGADVDVPVRLIDLMPTVLEAAGLSASPDEAEGIHMEGTSLIPLVGGNEVEIELREGSEVYCEGALVSCVRTNNWKYIDSQGHNTLALYDLLNDPGEKHNLFSEREDVARNLAERLRSYTELVRFYLEEHEGPTPIAVDEETRKRLRALGYVE
jgi:arylsulfatase A-like enzyme